MAVLRRPQTRADRAFDPQGITITGVSQSKPDPYVVVPGLTRLARTLPNGRPVFFVVYRPLRGTPDTQLGDVLHVLVPSSGGRSAAFVTAVMPPLLSYVYQQPPIEIVDGDIAAAKAPPHPVVFPSVATWLAADGREIKTVKYYVPSFPSHGIPKATSTETLTSSGTPVPASC